MKSFVTVSLAFLSSVTAFTPTQFNNVAERSTMELYARTKVQKAVKEAPTKPKFGLNFSLGGNNKQAVATKSKPIAKKIGVKKTVAKKAGSAQPAKPAFSFFAKPETKSATTSKRNVSKPKVVSKKPA